MANILTAEEASRAVAVEPTDEKLLDILPQVDAYVIGATGRDWTADETICPEAKAAAKGQRFNKKVQDKMAQRAKLAAVTVDWALVEQVVNAAKGVAVPVSQPTVGLDQFLASALLVENRIPDGATWDGSDRPVPIRDEAAVVAPVAASGGR